MKTVLVTGASRGLGRAIAETFAAGGYDTIGVARSVCEIPGVRTVQLDVCDEAAVTELIGSLETLDVVVNNAGIARLRPLLETPTTDLREILEVNVIGAFVVMREAARRMATHGGGLIINIASDAALKGIANMAPYAASKHALLGLARSVSAELRGQGVRVCTYCPGPIDTGILGPASKNPQALQPADIARTIVHLAELPAGMDIQEMLVEPMGM
ncbi:MAG: SDR family NAD(P)-dependent oxidoreductase [Verrucomicrobia bacterium]|nr:SDR family NAD(P)-dependent oxidoreductase [Verrucomicrobiota bacterium]